MKNKLLSSLKMLVISLLITQSLVAQNKESFFPSAELMPIGAYYYPEHWDSSQWERDIKRIADLGFEFTHFAEFAWSALEPEEGVYNFEWLDHCIQLADKYGLKVIMCTPSPCLPAWMSEKHPEVLAVNEDGRQIVHSGSRLTHSVSNKTYQKYVAQMVEKIAKRYGNDDRIWGWQIGNEPHLQTMYDYSKSSEAAFQAWLKNKYKTIDNLNKAWGTAFWSFTFNNFEQINLPNKKILGNHVHAMLDFNRFTGQEVANDLIRQAKILDANISEKQYITTNYAYFKFLPNVNPFLTRDDLDFSSHTMYLTSGWLNDSGDKLAHRLGSGMELAFSNEMAVSTNGYTGIMELQPGQINWGKYNSQPLPGAVRMWLWHSFALGDEFICTYRFRQPLYGGEQYHYGIMQTDGVSLSQGGEEYVKTINELNELKKHYNPKAKMPKSYASRQTAMLFNFDNINVMEQHKQTADWDSWQHVYTYYENAKTLGCDITFLQEDDNFDVKKYPFMLAPAYELVNDALIKKMETYVKAGGHLILSCRTGMKDKNAHLWEAKQQQPIWNLIGAQVQYSDHLPGNLSGTVNFNKKDYKWHVWSDILTPREGTETLASFTDQYYKNSSAIVRNKLGKGTVTYIGVWSDNRELEKQVMRKVYQDAGAEILDLPNYVFTEWRDGFWITVNYTAETVEAPVPANAKILIGQKTLKPAGVVVWQE